MFKNKLLNISIIITITILLLGVAGYYLYQYIFPDVKASASGELTIDERRDLLVNIPKINTNLGDSSIISLEMVFETDSEEVKEEIEKKMFEIKDSINLYLKNFAKDSFYPEDKITSEFKISLTNRLNKLLIEGKIKQVYITNIIFQ